MCTLAHVPIGFCGENKGAKKEAELLTRNSAFSISKNRPIAHFAGCDPSQTGIITGVLKDSNVSEHKLMV